MALSNSMSMSQVTLPAIGESHNNRLSSNQLQHDGVQLLANSPYGEVMGRKWPSKKDRRRGKLTDKQKVSGTIVRSSSERC